MTTQPMDEKAIDYLAGQIWERLDDSNRKYWGEATEAERRRYRSYVRSIIVTEASVPDEALLARTEVFTLREGSWQLLLDGVLVEADFNSKGAAEAVIPVERARRAKKAARSGEVAPNLETAKKVANQARVFCYQFMEGAISLSEFLYASMALEAANAELVKRLHETLGIGAWAMTRQERKAMAVGKKLAQALLAIEAYDGDPSDCLDEARLALRSMQRTGTREALAALVSYYEGGAA